MKIHRSEKGHNMMISVRHGFTGQVKSVYFQCMTCDPDGRHTQGFNPDIEGIEVAAEAAALYAEEHVKTEA